MSTCTHHLLDQPDGLCCTREDHPQNPGGHAYTASVGPDNERDQQPQEDQ